jgi:8-oxo-dGTP pyrophosphatase MutT (NUDIX family)
VLSIYHNLFDAWSIPGGHADGEDDMLNVAKKELQEETSLKNFKCLLDSPISIDALAIHSHFKKGNFVSSHIHLNTTYLFEGDENDSIHIKEDENSGVCWLTFDELLAKSTEPHMIPFYRKIIENKR